LESINIGTGRGVSVFELISEFEKITGKIVEFEVGNRRSGDVVIAYADNKKAKKY
jgi:UDP-glucose 4-epimerase